MMKKTFNTFLSLVSVTILAFSFASSSIAAPKKPIRLVYVEWDCALASTTLAKAAIEEHLGIPVEALPVGAAAMWVGVASGDADATLTAWLPVTHSDYLKKNENKINDLGPIVSGARLGWAVPAYVPVTSIADLDAQADKFNKRIIGIDPGSGLMRLSEQAIKDYGIKNMTLIEGSGATMVAALGSAIRDKQWIVVTAWSPHWMFGRWDLRYLEDPKQSLGGSESIHTFSRLNLEKDQPEVYEFLKRFHYTDIGQLQKLMDWNSQPNADTGVNAKRFMKENPDLVKSWFDKNYSKP